MALVPKTKMMVASSEVSVQKEEEGTTINLFRRCNLEGNSVFRKYFHVFMFPAGFQVLLLLYYFYFITAELQHIFLEQLTFMGTFMRQWTGCSGFLGRRSRGTTASTTATTTHRPNHLPKFVNVAHAPTPFVCDAHLVLATAFWTQCFNVPIPF